MDIQLMRLRKQAGYKNRDTFADKLGVNRFTYRSWETGAAMMSLEQAYRCAVELNCTIDEIAGYKRPLSDIDQRIALDEYYNSMNERGRAALLESARLMSGNPEARNAR